MAKYKYVMLQKLNDKGGEVAIVDSAAQGDLLERLCREGYSGVGTITTDLPPKALRVGLLNATTTRLQQVYDALAVLAEMDNNGWILL